MSVSKVEFVPLLQLHLYSSITFGLEVLNVLETLLIRTARSTSQQVGRSNRKSLENFNPASPPQYTFTPYFFCKFLTIADTAVGGCLLDAPGTMGEGPRG